jgi:hypothetical protein
VIKLLTTISIVFLLAGCTKEVTELPVQTDTGSNTFGAKVNGKFWMPQGFGVAPTAPILEAHYEPGRSIIINARNFATEPLESEFEFHLNNVKTPGVYSLNEHTGNYVYYVERKIIPTGEWKTNSQYTGSVNVTKTDTVNKIVSGTFEFQAATDNAYNNAPITVTEGRFDVKVQ